VKDFFSSFVISGTPIGAGGRTIFILVLAREFSPHPKPFLADALTGIGSPSYSEKGASVSEVIGT
jgi:hypothetical protein